jgi:putative membrane protein
VLIGLTDAGDGIKKAANGADQLSAGLTTANDGSHQLAGGANALANGLVTARNGSTALTVGAHQLSVGIGQATRPLIDALDGVQRLNLNPDDVGAVAAGLSSGIKTASDRIAALNVDHQLAAGIVDQVVGGLQASADPSMGSLGEALAGAQRLLNAQGLDPTTGDGLIRLRDGAQHLETEFGDPNSPTRKLLTQALNGQLKSDVLRLRDGAAQLDSGATKLNAGLVELADGGQQLAGGAQQLAAGTQKLSDGSRQLADGLDEGAAQLPTLSDQQRNAVARTVASPRDVPGDDPGVQRRETVPDHPSVRPDDLRRQRFTLADGRRHRIEAVGGDSRPVRRPCGVAGSELVGRQTQSAIHHGTAAPADRSVTIP